MEKTITLPSESDCIAGGYTVRDIAENWLRLESYDAAIPIEWMLACMDRGFDPRGRIVVSYDGPGCCGEFVALTREAAEFLAKDQA